MKRICGVATKCSFVTVMIRLRHKQPGTAADSAVIYNQSHWKTSRVQELVPDLLLPTEIW